MRRYVLLASFIFAASTVAAQQPLSDARLRKELADIQTIANDIMREAQRDAEVLRMLLEANRALDDWQKNNALTDALERISRAELLVGKPPMAHSKVRQSVRVAREIVAPAEESPTTADLQKLRDQLNSRPILWMREVVAEEMHQLAQMTTMLAEASTLLSKALAGTSASLVGRQE